MRLLTRSFALATALGLAPLAAPLALAAGADKPAARPAAKPTGKPATSHQQLRSQAKGLALAEETVEQISQGQLDVAARVLTGDADCEFAQQVSVRPVAGQPGHFNVGFKKAVYRMVPQETTTGAVRLEDKRAGMVWLQIPSKSMLMNAKVGQRMVDACMHAEQRAAVAAAQDATQNTRLGIAPAAVAAAPGVAPAPVAAAAPGVAVAAAGTPAPAPAPAAGTPVLAAAPVAATPVSPAASAAAE